MTSRMVFNKALLITLWLISCVTQAATGPEVAQLLNSRYKNTPAECVGNNPAYFCSGVLLLASQGPDEFWKHDAPSTSLGARSVTYMRADLDTRTLAQKNGAVFSDQFTAVGLGKPLNVLCAYPFEFPLQSTRPDFGCGWTAATSSLQDASSCAALGVTDTQGWLTHFEQEGNQPVGQCSLSSQDPAQFMVSLTAHQSLGADWSAKPTLLQVKNWNAQAPKQLPLQGLFYDVTHTGSLLGAQKDQRDYFTATGDWLPILRMDLTQAPDAVFGFNQQDQLYVGYQVASRLNARYADTAPACRGNTPAYDCNGILIRITDASPAFHAWNPSDGSIARNGVAFSYMRADVHLPVLAWANQRYQGLIMKEMAAPTAYPLTVRCAYPIDGATFYRSDSCNEHSGSPQASVPCAKQGITTEQAWIDHVYKQPDKLAGCSFTGETHPFEVSVRARALLNAPEQVIHNEVIIATWPQNIADKLPLEAFFYAALAARPNAQFLQRDYFQQTGRFLPIVYVDLAAAPGHVISYDPEDQTVQNLPMPTIADETTRELNVSSLVGTEQLRVAPWLKQAPGQRVWLSYAGFLENGDATQQVVWRGQTAGPPSGALALAPIAWLKSLKEGRDVTVTFKVNFDKVDDEAKAVSFPLRVYTVKK
jgi:hypothetical protein